jgi:glycosyltransferase involved in cell wall biosynthesis
MAQGTVLFVFPFENEDAKEFAESLARGLKEWDIKLSDQSVRASLFEAQKYDIAHFFQSASVTKLKRTIRKGSKTKIVQTFISLPQQPEDYKRSIFADAVVTFSEWEKQEILRQHPKIPVLPIPPCVMPQKIENLEAPQAIRQRYDVQDRLFAVALNDFNNQEHFTTFLYTVREYQRRGGFRLLIPLYHPDRQSLLWRTKLQNAIDQEKLHATTLLQTEVNLHSLIEAADITLMIDKNNQKRPFSFPLSVVEALCAGKPVITHNLPPVHEVIAEFRESWLVKAYEDFSRISRDLLKEKASLERLSTELARFARARMSVEKVAESHENLYNSLLSR